MPDNNSYQYKFEENADTPDIIIARVAVIGCGWWAQGWHLPHLAAHNTPRRGGRIQIAAVVNLTQNPTSTLTSSPLLSLSELATKYNCPCYPSVSVMLADEAVGPTLDGAIIATSHASHYQVGMSLLREGISRRQQHNAAYRVMNILMEKPMTTDVMEARSVWELSTNSYPEGEISHVWTF
jgi:predicted dehydrogenase